MFEFSNIKMTELHPGPLRLRPSSLMCFLLRAEQEPTLLFFFLSLGLIGQFRVRRASRCLHEASEAYVSFQKGFFCCCSISNKSGWHETRALLRFDIYSAVAVRGTFRWHGQSKRSSDVSEFYQGNYPSQVGISRQEVGPRERLVWRCIMGNGLKLETKVRMFPPETEKWSTVPELEHTFFFF